MTEERPKRKLVRGTLAERLEAWSEQRGDCLVFAGHLNKNGYGCIRTADGMRHAHRVAYRLVHGEIPDGMQIDHICHNRACIKDSHLQMVTRKQNCENLSGPHVDSTTGVRGVHWKRREKKYTAKVKHAGVDYHVGYFRTLAEAEAAVIAKRNELFTNNLVDRSRHDLP